MTLKRLAIGIAAAGLAAAVSASDASARPYCWAGPGVRASHAAHYERVCSARHSGAWGWGGLLPGYYNYVGVGYGPCVAGIGYGECTFNGWW
jgi:hypothetical protein